MGCEIGHIPVAKSQWLISSGQQCEFGAQIPTPIPHDINQPDLDLYDAEGLNGGATRISFHSRICTTVIRHESLPRHVTTRLCSIGHFLLKAAFFQLACWLVGCLATLL